MTAIESVLEVLTDADFERLPKPLMVAGASFAFDAAVKGTRTSNDLVVVATNETPAPHIARLLSALSRTLDQVRSRRPVTLILLGLNANTQPMASLEMHARVLTIASASPDVHEIRRAIAVLLPLTLPDRTSSGEPPLTVVARKLGSSLSDEHKQFIDAAQIGPNAVQERLRRFIDEAATGQSFEGTK
ncbi:hypothetical protein [Mycobacterium sp. Root265]|uniref:hypothetical protein n=1 Tax=Mycobacterium sp. Root265 TaxID=1736504 RepID=UPI0012E3E083|nr:hypothetical protein [Mycobacterium sp. Root265]